MPVKTTTSMNGKTGTLIKIKKQYPFQPLGCWKIDDMYFAFDKWFVLPYASTNFEILEKKYSQVISAFQKQNIQGKPKIALFGHADPVGKDDYNKILSEKRAKAVYGILIKDINVWKELYPSGEEIKYLQKRIGTYETGTFDSTTENQLKSYLDSFTSLKLTKEDFIGEKGEYAYQGCSEFNPVLVLSLKEYAEYNATGDIPGLHFENQVNRRVLGFMFLPDIDTKKNKWPCPKAPDTGKCMINFHGSAANRLITGNHKEFKNSDKTFSCEFYTDLAENLPCEYFYEPEVIDFDVEGSKDGHNSDNVVYTLATLELKNKGKVRYTKDENNLKNLYDDFKSEYEKRCKKVGSRFTHEGISRSIISIYEDVNNMSFENFKKASQTEIMAFVTCKYDAKNKTYTCYAIENSSKEVLFFESLNHEDNIQNSLKLTASTNNLYQKIKKNYINITQRIREELYLKRKKK